MKRQKTSDRLCEIIERDCGLTRVRVRRNFDSNKFTDISRFQGQGIDGGGLVVPFHSYATMTDLVRHGSVQLVGNELFEGDH